MTARRIRPFASVPQRSFVTGWYWPADDAAALRRATKHLLRRSASLRESSSGSRTGGAGVGTVDVVVAVRSPSRLSSDCSEPAGPDVACICVPLGRVATRLGLGATPEAV